MAKFQVVSRSLHSNKRVKKATNLFFARQDNVLALGASELPKMLMSTAIAFMTINDSPMPVALQGFLPGQNLFVANDGTWLSNYIPAMYLCYPFSFARAETSELMLCVDEESGLITEASSGDGELFFEGEKPSATVDAIMNNLHKIEQDQQKSRVMCSVLQKYEVFEPWPIKIQSDNNIQTVEGINRINETKLHTVDGHALAELRDTGALALAYGQLFSMHNLQKLGKLATAQQPQPLRQDSLQDTAHIDFGVMEDSGSISFDNL